MENIQIPANFAIVIGDFTSDLSTTFPEYNNIWKDMSSTMNETEVEHLYKFCMNVYPERFFDILYQNSDIFSEKDESNTHFLPNIDFKLLYNSEGVTDNIRKTIWKYLQLVLFTVVGGIKDKSSFGDSMNLFEGIDEDELQEKMNETMSGLTDFFKNMETETSNSETSNDNNSSEETHRTSNMDGMPDMENMQDHLKALFNGKIGSLAKEMAEEISGEFEDILGEGHENASPQDLIKSLMKNPAKIMGLMKTVGGKLDAKLKNGDISREEIMKEAGDLLGKMKESSGGDEFTDMFSKMAKGMGGAGMGDMFSKMAKGMGGAGNGGADMGDMFATMAKGLGKNMKLDTNAINRMTKTTKLKEDMMSRHRAKQEKMMEKARQEAILVQQRIEAQEKLAATFSLNSTGDSNYVFKLNDESSQEKSFIHPDLLKYLEEDDKPKVEEKTNKKKKKKKKK
jgi:hypothetical protein